MWRGGMSEVMDAQCDADCMGGGEDGGMDEDES